MRVVFMGTPAYAARIFTEISQQHEVVAVFTRPDAVRGRGNSLLPSPVKEEALKRGIPVYCPETLKDAHIQQEIRDLAADVLVVAAYGMLLPQEVIDAAPYGAINAHASLLPRWRGAAPIERAILAGDAEVGVCAMRIDLELDTGPYCASRSLPVEHRNASELLEELSLLGAQALLSALAQFEAGEVFWVEQDASSVTYAHKLEKGELNLSWEDSAVLADRKVRASSDAHPCRCEIADKSVTLLSACAHDAIDCLAHPLEPGQLAFVDKRLFMGMAEGVLEVLRLKPQGKKAMDAQSFAAGIQNIKNQTKNWRILGN